MHFYREPERGEKSIQSPVLFFGLLGPQNSVLGFWQMVLRVQSYPPSIWIVLILEIPIPLFATLLCVTGLTYTKATESCVPLG